jgi:hypothetical protein
MSPARTSPSFQLSHQPSLSRQLDLDIAISADLQDDGSGLCPCFDSDATI